MTTYTAITNGQVDADSPVDAPLMQALRDNPLSMQEMATGAPILQSNWHPYNGTLVGTGNGNFWDQSVHGTARTTTTPNFEDGYEYAIYIYNFRNGSGATNLDIEFYQETTGAYTSKAQIMSTMAATFLEGILYIPMPRRAHTTAIARWGDIWDNPGTAADVQVALATTEKITNVRITQSTGSWQDGLMFLFRRRELFSGV